MKLKKKPPRARANRRRARQLSRRTRLSPPPRNPHTKTALTADIARGVRLGMPIRLEDAQSDRFCLCQSRERFPRLFGDACRRAEREFVIADVASRLKLYLWAIAAWIRLPVQNWPIKELVFALDKSLEILNCDAPGLPPEEEKKARQDLRESGYHIHNAAGHFYASADFCRAKINTLPADSPPEQKAILEFQFALALLNAALVQGISQTINERLLAFKTAAGRLCFAIGGEHSLPKDETNRWKLRIFIAVQKAEWLSGFENSELENNFTLECGKVPAPIRAEPEFRDWLELIECAKRHINRDGEAIARVSHLIKNPASNPNAISFAHMLMIIAMHQGGYNQAAKRWATKILDLSPTVGHVEKEFARRFMQNTQ